MRDSTELFAGPGGNMQETWAFETTGMIRSPMQTERDRKIEMPLMRRNERKDV